LELLLAQPLSRLKLLVTQSAVTVAGVGLLSGSVWLGTAVGIWTTDIKEEARAAWELPFSLPGLGSEVPIPFAEPEVRHVPTREVVDVGVFGPATLNLFAMGLMLAGFSCLVSSWDRYRWRTVGIVVAVCVIQLILKVAGMATDRLDVLLYFSAFTAYEPEAFTRLADITPQLAWNVFLYDERGAWTGYGPLWCDSLMAGIGLISYVLAGVIFHRRDVPAPL
jgi:ABC-2 type transport system permease protein